MSPERALAQAQANARWARTLIDAWVALGLRELVASPGARSTPLLLAADAHPDLSLRLVTDERVAGFLALGIARGAGRPVALLSTSGSAGAHWLPALVEAREARLGLIALTANRPHELSECGAPQAVPQGHFFQDQVGLQRSLPAPGPDPSPRELRSLQTLALRAWEVASGPAALPVHLDLAFRKPLWLPEAEPVPATPGERPVPRGVRGERRLARRDLKELAAELGGAARGLVYCGPDAAGADGARLARAAAGLAERLGWPLLADAASGVRGAADALEAGEALARSGAVRRRLSPELVLRFGGDPTHKALGAWLAESRTLVVDRAGRTLDPHHAAERFVATDPVALCADLAPLLPASEDASWLGEWRRAAALAREALATSLADEELWAGAVAAELIASRAPGELVHVASSMAIRDVDAFARVPAGVALSSNRGANGIDGTLSTAWGLSLVHEGRVSVLLGDLAFLHDLGGLAAAGAAGAKLTVVVVDNGGGGIFSLLPIAAHASFEPCFLTPPGADLASLAQAVGGALRPVRTKSELRAALEEPAEGLVVVLAQVERAHEEASRRAAFAAARAALERAFATEEARP